jgi:hypothetical protein
MTNHSVTNAPTVVADDEDVIVTFLVTQRKLEADIQSDGTLSALVLATRTDL